MLVTMCVYKTNQFLNGSLSKCHSDSISTHTLPILLLGTEAQIQDQNRGWISPNVRPESVIRRAYCFH